MKVRVGAWVSEGRGKLASASVANAFTQHMNTFIPKLRQAQVEAAHAANQTSLRKLKRRRPIASPRPGRNDRSIRNTLRWEPSGTGVKLNVNRLNAEAPHWIIQEIGTNETANVRTAGVKLPVGRPRKGSTTSRHVKSQVGRRISRRLVWADQAGNFAQYQPGRHQLELASKVSGVPYRRKTIVIGKEIEPQHFVRDGAKEGFRVYRQSVLAAARQTLTKKR